MGTTKSTSGGGGVAGALETLGSPLVLVGGSESVKVVTLNRPHKLNTFTYEMVLQLLKVFRALESDSSVKLVIVKGNGRTFCAGGDVAAMITYMTAGHWTFGTRFYQNQLTLHYTLATYAKPLVFLIHGFVMGGGAGLSMNGRFRVVTENTVFAMPEAELGLFTDVGASYFLHKLPGFFREYVCMTGARLDGAEMLACGLATHFVPSENFPLIEEALCKVGSGDPSIISEIIHQFETWAPLKKEGHFYRLDFINENFSKDTVEEILYSLEDISSRKKDEWAAKVIECMKKASPMHLNITLKSIRGGRSKCIEDCLMQEYRFFSHVMRGTISPDFYEGVRAKLVDKDNNPKWQPSKLEMVTKEMIDTYYMELDEDEDWEDLKLPAGRSSRFVELPPPPPPPFRAAL